MSKSEVIGLDDTERRMTKLLERFEPSELKEKFWPLATQLRDRMKELAPYNPKRASKVKSGQSQYHLRFLIFAAPGEENKADILVGVPYSKNAKFGRAPHAHLLEFGTVKMQARPFFRPAIAQLGPSIESAIVKAVDAEVYL